MAANSQAFLWDKQRSQLIIRILGVNLHSCSSQHLSFRHLREMKMHTANKLFFGQFTRSRILSFTISSSSCPLCPQFLSDLKSLDRNAGLRIKET